MSATADAIAEVFLRLRKSVAAGGVMAGWAWDAVPVERVEGGADKTSLFVSMPEVTEAGKGSTLAEPRVRFTFGVSSLKRRVREEQDAVEGAVGDHAADLDALKNGVELDANEPRGRDPLLAGMLAEPLLWEQAATQVQADSFNTTINLVLRLRPVLRGAR